MARGLSPWVATLLLVLLVFTAGQTTVAQHSDTEQPATITGLSPTSARWSHVVTITGDGFGQDHGRVLVGGVEQETILAWNPDTIRFAINGGTPPGTRIPVLVELAARPTSPQEQDNFLDRTISGPQTDAGHIHIANYLLPEDGSDVITGVVVFRIREGSDATAIAKRNGLGAPQQVTASRSESSLNRYFEAEADDNDERNAVLRTAEDSDVEWAEPAFIGLEPTATPNDPLLLDQWGIDQISSRQAWNYSRGANITVGIVDSGVDAAHPDLHDHVAGQRDFTGTGVADGCGHGTHVAGIAAAVTNNGQGIAAAGWATNFISYKVLDNACGGGTAARVEAAIDQAVADGVSAINLSLATANAAACPARVQTAIDEAATSNILVVVAAGNNQLQNPPWPASCNNTFDVAASTRDDDIANFSNFGTWIDLSAPGVDIMSTTTNGPSCGSALQYGRCTGTSMAAPFVTGTAALLYRAGANRAAATNHLWDQSDNMSCFRGPGNCGRGRLNAGIAVQGQRFRVGAALAATPGSGYWLFDRPGTVAVFGDCPISRSAHRSACSSNLRRRESRVRRLLACR